MSEPEAPLAVVPHVPWWRSLAYAARDWILALRFYWYGFKVGIVHGSESPGCAGSRIELRFDPTRGEHWYCNGCLRPIKGAPHVQG